METNQKNETLVSLDLSEIELKALEALQKPGEDLNTTATRIITEKLNNQNQLEIAERKVNVGVLENVFEIINEKQDATELNHEIAAELLKARVELAQAEGTFSPNQVKSWTKELFS